MRQLHEALGAIYLDRASVFKIVCGQIGYIRAGPVKCLYVLFSVRSKNDLLLILVFLKFYYALKVSSETPNPV